MEAIEASATLKFGRVSPQKTRLVADLIRGKKADDAVKILSFTQKKGARVLLKILKSAIANAEVKNVEDTELLDVSQVWVGQGPVTRRYKPRARGRADVLRRPTSHITVVVKEDLKAKEEAAAKLAELEAKKARKKAEKKKAAGKKPKAAAGKSEKEDKKKKSAADKGKAEAKDKKAGTKAEQEREAKAKAKAKTSKPEKDK
ncbi:LSU ribosomal protein L22p (L17e) [hydrothermal vent metagenome]|uniref:LSU ribosomal protein L22p (L17e) n=1 Tax=hydrothermal vent metagenome TaxID=652676 RepID=A0A3B1BGP5_9ZZZZ